MAEVKTEKLTLGGGCFWCIEAVYESTLGVIRAESGYMGGNPALANYEAVCSGTTGHAEVVQISYDVEQVDLEELLDVFFVVHNPTTLNQQGADRGTQYRSVIYYENDAMKNRIDAAIKKAQVKYSEPIVTEVSPIESFFVAEGYHQNYFKNNPNQGYCQAVVAPKVEKFKSTFRDMIK